MDGYQQVIGTSDRDVYAIRPAARAVAATDALRADVDRRLARVRDRIPTAEWMGLADAVNNLEGAARSEAVAHLLGVLPSVLGVTGVVTTLRSDGAAADAEG